MLYALVSTQLRIGKHRGALHKEGKPELTLEKPN